MALPSTKVRIHWKDSEGQSAVSDFYFPGTVTSYATDPITTLITNVDALSNAGIFKLLLMPCDKAITGAPPTVGPIGTAEDKIRVKVQSQTTGDITYFDLPCPASRGTDFQSGTNENLINLSATNWAPVVTWLEAHCVGVNGEAVKVLEMLKIKVKRHMQ